MRTQKKPPEITLFEKTKHRGECIVFTGFCNPSGYGVIYTSNQKHKLAHRLSYELKIGSIPEGMLVCHKCDNPPCINPNHLFIGTSTDNMRDMANKGRSSNNKGEKNPNKKLSKKDVDFIRKNYKIIKQIDLANMFGVKRHNIYRIQSGKTWV